MLHCASVAVVVRPLALVAGELAVAAVGTGVAQIHGIDCEPSRTGPPLGWSVTGRRALGGDPAHALLRALVQAPRGGARCFADVLCVDPCARDGVARPALDREHARHGGFGRVVAIVRPNHWASPASMWRLRTCGR